MAGEKFPSGNSDQDQARWELAGREAYMDLLLRGMMPGHEGYEAALERRINQILGKNATDVVNKEMETAEEVVNETSSEQTETTGEQAEAISGAMANKILDEVTEAIDANMQKVTDAAVQSANVIVDTNKLAYGVDLPPADVATLNVHEAYEEARREVEQQLMEISDLNSVDMSLVGQVLENTYRSKLSAQLEQFEDGIKNSVEQELQQNQGQEAEDQEQANQGKEQFIDGLTYDAEGRENLQAKLVQANKELKQKYIDRGLEDQYSPIEIDLDGAINKLAQETKQELRQGGDENLERALESKSDKMAALFNQHITEEISGEIDDAVKKADAKLESLGANVEVQEVFSDEQVAKLREHLNEVLSGHGLEWIGGDASKEQLLDEAMTTAVNKLAERQGDANFGGMAYTVASRFLEKSVAKKDEALMRKLERQETVGLNADLSEYLKELAEVWDESALDLREAIPGIYENAKRELGEASEAEYLNYMKAELKSRAQSNYLVNAVRAERGEETALSDEARAERNRATMERVVNPESLRTEEDKALFEQILDRASERGWGPETISRMAAEAFAKDRFGNKIFTDKAYEKMLYDADQGNLSASNEEKARKAQVEELRARATEIMGGRNAESAVRDIKRKLKELDARIAELESQEQNAEVASELLSLTKLREEIRSNLDTMELYNQQMSVDRYTVESATEILQGRSLEEAIEAIKNDIKVLNDEIERVGSTAQTAEERGQLTLALRNKLGSKKMQLERLRQYGDLPEDVRTMLMASGENQAADMDDMSEVMEQMDELRRENAELRASLEDMAKRMTAAEHERLAQKVGLKARVRGFLRGLRQRMSAKIAMLAVATFAGAMTPAAVEVANATSNPGIESVDLDAAEDEEEEAETEAGKAKKKERAKQETGQKSEKEEATDGEFMVAENGVRYNSADWVDWDDKNSRHSFGSSTLKESLNEQGEWDEKLAKEAYLSRAEMLTEVLSSFVTDDVWGGEILESCGLDKSMDKFQLDERLSAGKDGGELQQRLLKALREKVNSDEVKFSHRELSGLYKTEYIKNRVENAGEEVTLENSTPENLYLGEDIKVRHNAPHIVIEYKGRESLRSENCGDQKSELIVEEKDTGGELTDIPDEAPVYPPTGEGKTYDFVHLETGKLVFPKDKEGELVTIVPIPVLEEDIKPLPEPKPQPEKPTPENPTPGPSETPKDEEKPEEPVVTPDKPEEKPEPEPGPEPEEDKKEKNPENADRIINDTLENNTDIKDEYHDQTENQEVEEVTDSPDVNPDLSLGLTDEEIEDIIEDVLAENESQSVEEAEGGSLEQTEASEDEVTPAPGI